MLFIKCQTKNVMNSFYIVYRKSIQDTIQIDENQFKCIISMTLKALFIYKPMWRILQMWVESPYIIITPTVIIIITRRTTVFISAKMKHTMRRYDFSLNWRLSFITYFDGILISINIKIFSPSIFPWNDTCEKEDREYKYEEILI